MRAVLSAVLVTALAAADPVPPPPDAVAVVGGRPITLRQVEDALLAKEGADKLVQWVAQQVESVPWSELKDDAVVLTVNGHELRRRDLALLLLKDQGGKVREDLISIAIVEQALARDGVALDVAALDREWGLMERRFQADLKAKGQDHIDFESWVRHKEKQSRAQFMAQPGFRLAAGIHELVRRRAEATPEAELRRHFEAHPGRWDEPEAVRLGTVFLPCRMVENPDGSRRPADGEKDRLWDVAQNLWLEATRKQVPFARLYAAFGRLGDPHQDAQGMAGWVAADGRRLERAEARRIPAPVIAAALAAKGPFPVVLPPVAHELGVEVVQVAERRPGRRVEFAEARPRVIAELVEQTLDERTRRLLHELRQASGVDYLSIPEAVRRRGGQ